MDGSLEKPSVLIVEHESLIRLNIVDVAEDAGYEVLEAANADEATEILERSHNIEVVFTTLRMPGSMDGLALASAIRSRWPLIRVIVTSGRDVKDYPDFPPNCLFIQKPYENRRIAEALRELIIPQ
jgi:two-component system, response regulator PdtaR